MHVDGVVGDGEKVVEKRGSCRRCIEKGVRFGRFKKTLICLQMTQLLVNDLKNLC